MHVAFEVSGGLVLPWRLKGQSLCQCQEYAYPQVLPWLRSSANVHPSEREEIALFCNFGTDSMGAFCFRALELVELKAWIVPFNLQMCWERQLHILGAP